MENLNGVKQLLSQVNTLSKAYDLVAKNTGENFNIFSILGMERSEVKTHSKIVAELLNPKGSHEQGDDFLKLFIQQLEQKFPEKFPTIEFENPHLTVEKYIGKVNNDEGGRIDIFIEDGKNAIAVENKIDAGEQHQQLKRYSKYCEGKNYAVIYLTLDGKESKTNNDSEYFTISYEEDIINWLELCKKEAVNLPILREAIGQYINLIKKLTHQTINKKMEKDIQVVILKNFEESELIYKNFEKALYGLFNTILLKIEIEIKNYIQNSNWEIFRVERFDRGGYGHIMVRPKEIEDNIGIAIQGFNPIKFENYFNGRTFVGIFHPNSGSLFSNNLDENLEEINNTKYWVNYEYIPDFHNLEVRPNNSELLILLSSESMMDEFVSHLFLNFKEYFEKYSTSYANFLRSLKKDKETQIHGLAKHLESVGIKKENIDFTLDNSVDRFLLKIREWNFNGKNYVLGLQFEFDNDYYFFCMIEDGKNRQPINNQSQFMEIRTKLKNSIEGLSEFNEWFLAKSKDYKIGINKNDYYYRDNDNIFQNLSHKIKKLYDIASSL